MIKKIKKLIQKLNIKKDEIEILEEYKPEETKKFNFNRKRIKKIACSILLLSISIFLIITIVSGKKLFAKGTEKLLNSLGIYTSEIKKVEISSDDYNNPGSWHINKSAEWTGLGKAQVTFDVNSIIKNSSNYKDIIIVLDVSGSMAGSKIVKAKSDCIELINTLLSNENNKIALITFETNSNIVSNFSNNKEELINYIETLNTGGNTNYNSALLNVDKVMEGYVKESNRNLVTLFLTDGYPNENTPNQVGTYKLLKDKYPYMEINGVQYEMGKAVINEIKQVSDNQWVADQSSLNNVLFEASIEKLIYEEFVVTDYINNDYFIVDSVDDIKVTMGTVTLENENGIQKIVWNLGEFYSGGNAKMFINLKLKNEIFENKASDNFYPTNLKETITSKFPNEETKEVTSNDTPVLKNGYYVTYDTNTPDGCTLPSYEKEKYFSFETVKKKNEKLSCDGYLFKGWEFDEEDEKDVTKVNDDMFIMPEHDVTIRGTWTKQSIVKTVEGEVHDTPKLYRVLQKEANSGGLALEYKGNHQDSMNGIGNKKIYYYNIEGDFNYLNQRRSKIENKNNVIFAGQCWRMLRTTDTGGVKMIYNGEASSDGSCLKTRENHVGYNGAGVIYINQNNNYYYGTNYTYDNSTKKFTLTGEKVQSLWNKETSSSLIGKYTCLSETEDGTCSTLYYILELYNNESENIIDPFAIEIDSNIKYYTLGKMRYNYGGYLNNTPSDIGYMYNDSFEINNLYYTNNQSFTNSKELLYSHGLSTSYLYANDVSWGSPSKNSYNLVDTFKISSYSEYMSLVGKYSFLSSSNSTSGSSVDYIAGADKSDIYYKYLTNGKLLSDYKIFVADSITDNKDGSYTLNNPEYVSLIDWFNNYSKYNYKYVCNDSNNITCTDPKFITRTANRYYYYVSATDKILIAKGRNGLTLTDTLLISYDKLFNNPDKYSDYKYTCNTTNNVCDESSLRLITDFGSSNYYYVSNYYFGSNVAWDGTNYTLIDPIDMENYDNLEALSTHHYICLTPGLKKCESVAYVYYDSNSSYMYITLSNGVNIEKALNIMLTKNTKDSALKRGIDAWYEKNLINYSDYLEDVIFCNNRTINDLGGWNSKGGKLNNRLNFFGGDYKSELVNTQDLSCKNKEDQFSVSNNYAKLKYPIALMTLPESNLSDDFGILFENNSTDTWLLTPFSFDGGYAYMFTSFSIGEQVTYPSYVNPVISLKPGIEYSDGDGSRLHPYIIDTN